MDPFHPSRDDARAFTARAGAALAVFFVLAVVLLAGGGNQPLAVAEANKGDTGAGDAAVMGQTSASTVEAPAAEPVLGAAPAEAPPVEAPPVEAAPVEAPPVEAPPVEAAPVEAPPADAAPAEAPPAAAAPAAAKPPAVSKPAPSVQGSAGARDLGGGDDDEGDDGGDGSSGGGQGRSHDDDDDDGWHGGDDDDGSHGGDDDDDGSHGGGDDDDGDDDDGSSGGQTPPPTGGGKGGDDDDGDDGEPAPSGRPQVTPTATQAPGEGSVEGGEVSQPGPATTQPGGGVFVLADNDPTARPREVASQGITAPAGGESGGSQNITGTGTGGTAAGDTADTGSAPAGASGPTPAGEAGGASAGGDEAGSGSGSGSGSGGGGGAGAGAGGGGEGQNDGEGGSSQDQNQGPTDFVTRRVRDLVEVVPDSIKAALAALAALSVLLGVGYLLAALRARRLARQRRELLQEVGLLQTALLPPVPDKVGALLTSVAYRPADGPGAGGDFYDVLPLAGGSVGFILGDVSGHGRGALARTAFMRYTLRAYLEAGLEPRVALQVAGRVIDENLGGDFATVLLAVHDPETGSLTYATAGHPAPIVVGPEPHEPVTAGSSPPIGVGVRTGLRQTTLPLVPGSVAALFTDGLMEARTEKGILGRERLQELLAEIEDDPSAHRLIEQVSNEATLLSDDMAAVVVTPTAAVTAGLFRTEQLELSARELDGPIARRFLEATGLPEEEIVEAEREARQLAGRFGGVVLHVVYGNKLSVEVLPRNVESIEAASRRVSAGTAR